VKPQTICILNKSLDCYSSGTRVTVISDENVEWEKPGDTNSSGYVTVQLTSPPNTRFDVEYDYLTPIRPRATVVTPTQRANKRAESERLT
jgi:hypothetical protein